MTKTVGQVARELAVNNSFLVLEFALRYKCFPDDESYHLISIDGLLLSETPGYAIESAQHKQLIDDLKELLAD